MKLSVRVTPNAKRDEVLGWKDNILRVKVSAPPVDGKANAAVLKLLSGTLGIPKSTITIVGGQASRLKVIDISEADPEKIHQVLSRGQKSFLS